MRNTILTAITGLLLVASGCVFVDVGLGRPKLREVTVEESERWFETNRIALIDVDGFIASGGQAWSFFAGTTVADVKEKLERAADDHRVVAVVLRVNSPGGEASASDMIYREIRSFREKTGKPVVAALMGVAASGGYYVACAADRIVAQQTCITGSVGVVMRFYNLEGLYWKIGLREEVIKSGAMKDIGAMGRQPTPEEIEVLQHLNQSLYDRFLAAVKEGRPKMGVKDFAAIADGRPLTAAEAATMHMVDRVGYLDEAIAEARSLAGVESADVIAYSPRPSHNTNIYTSLSPLAGRTPAAGRMPVTGAIETALEALVRQRGPMFLYLWDPGS